MAPGIVAAQQASSPTADSSAATLPEIRVIGTTPLPPPRPVARPAASTATPAANVAAPAEPGAIDRDKVPSNVQTLSAADFDPATTPSLLDALMRGLPGVALSDQTGNQFQLDLNYRGFIASPVIGTPQGIAVYQNGVRINEVFGDIVNWDFIPQNAVNRLTLVPSNPVYGLNAIGGALSFEMKNGYTYHGVEGEVNGGSYGRIGTSVQAGGQVGNLSGYITADAVDDAGWREDSPSQLRRVYADLGARGDQTEYHVTFTGASNNFGAAAATPVQMLDQNWSSVYTIPQTTQNQLAFLTASASWKPSDTLTYQANVYYRNFRQSHVDGNGTDAQNSGCPDPAVLCFPNLNGTLSNLITTTGQTVPATGLLGTSVLGEIDRTWTTTNSFGGTAQAASSAKVFGHDNNFVAGMSIDRGLVQFSTTSELGTVNANQFPFVQGSGLFIDQPSGDVAPVGLGATTLYTGLYTTDTFDVTPRLSLTAGGRFNFAQIILQDELGNDPLLNGNHEYSRFNPAAGATYKLTPNVTLYGGYSEANRAPTPLELGCSDPLRPCLIDNALVGDPNLQQVVSHTFEAGLRGLLDPGKGQLTWTVGAYHTLNTNDIINVASPIPGHEYFKNGGDTLRQGIEANATYKWDRWNVYANYTYVDATFLNALTLSSPFNPYADANGNIFVVPGDHLTGIPDFRLKLGAEYRITDPWKLGADLNVIGSQYLVGDESNQNPKIPAYWVVNLHSSYQISKNFEVFGLVKNLFNQRALLCVRHLLRYHLVSLFELDRPAHLRARHAVRRLCRSAGDVLAARSFDGSGCCRGQAGKLQAQGLETLPRAGVISLGIRPRFALSVEIKPAPPVRGDGRRELKDRVGTLVDGAHGSSAGLAHHGRVHVGRGMQGIDRDAGAVKLTGEIDRKHDLGKLALAISARAAVALRQHHVGKVDRLLSERGDVDDARGRAFADKRQ
jgi:iron complex outermembrane receptor protein